MIAEHFQENRKPDEKFNDFLARVGTDPIKELAEKCADIPSLNGDSQTLYMDWEKTIAYKVERGRRRMRASNRPLLIPSPFSYLLSHAWERIEVRVIEMGVIPVVQGVIPVPLTSPHN